MDILKEQWQNILQKVKTDLDLSDFQFETWFSGLKVYDLKDDTIYVALSREGEFAIQHFERKYSIFLQGSIEEVTGKVYKLKYIMPTEIERMRNQAKKAESANKNHSISLTANLNPKYTFDTFVVGGNNNLAQAASLAVAESPGDTYNPLYIYGGPGLGKTHLMQSIGNFILQNNPASKLIYVTSEAFTNEVVEAIRFKTTQKLREKYRTVDVFMLDDIQFIIDKESTQEEFFHTFNELHQAGKQIIITSDKPPKDLVTLEERIRSRLGWGVPVDIGTPDYETRMAILHKKQENVTIKLDDEILNYIAMNIKSNVRDLEGALNKLRAYANLENTQITLEIAQKQLQTIISPDKPREVTPQLILEIVSDHFQISLDDMISRKKQKSISEPRQIVMYLCRELTDESQSTIGMLLGGKDHTTVKHGAEKIAELVQNSEEMRETIKMLKKKINPD